ncbi:hypothetical protein DUI87_00875 [Hirundo rustica rustica]|uniref:Rho guanine nucleotide exchange factor 6 n=1 Tax=Hirundo rustica rustica TaxID=333673 RepID=A0A3M0L3B5_HIRRU|nr:hypothetical protein DUI87_00875 [Hirundo rustica rustica]
MEMTENGSHQLVVKARFNFKQTNEDELSVNKGDIIYVTRVEEGGWWEGTLNGKTGWFPSNYVREIKSTDKPLSPKALKGLENTQLTKNYYPVVLQNILETERDYAKELQSLLGTYLRPLQSYDKLTAGDIMALLGNMEEISAFQQTLNQALEEVAKLPENQQCVGGCFMNLMPQFHSLYLTYCANHPSAVNVLTQHSDELEEFMESQGAASPGILILTTSLSKPFLRLDKYVTLLQELEWHMEEAHADHEDVLRAITSFKSLVSQCQELRKRKQLELQILSESIQHWEGEDIKIMGNIIYMSQVMVQSGESEVSVVFLLLAKDLVSEYPLAPGEKEERYFLLFSNVLLMLSASPRMSGFIYQGKLPLTGMTLTKLEDAEGNEHMFEITEDILYLKGTAALEEDAQILKVIEAYCTGGSFQQALSSGSRKDSIPQVLLPEEEKIIIGEIRSNGQTVKEEKSLVDTVYALKDEVKELKQENKRMKQCLEEELKFRKDLEKLVRRLLKQTDECGREDMGRKSSLIA